MAMMLPLEIAKLIYVTEDRLMLVASYVLLRQYIISSDDETTRRSTYYWPPSPAQGVKGRSKQKILLIRIYLIESLV